MTPAVPILRSSARAQWANDRSAIETHLTAMLATPGVPVSPFRQAMQYAVLGQGQRIRPILALRVARLAGHEGPLTLRAAASVELLHCASLIVDDLPCMDNDATRRNRPSTHIKFGESTALLAAFGLVAIAARGVVEQPCPPTHVSGLISYQCQLLRVLDASGLCEGQDLDLRLSATQRHQARTRINELKTVPLFELAAAAGLLFTDADSILARAVRAFARDYGRAFQIVDDYLDGEILDLGVVDAALDRARAHLAHFDPAAADLAELVEHLDVRCR